MFPGYGGKLAITQWAFANRNNGAGPEQTFFRGVVCHSRPVVNSSLGLRSYFGALGDVPPGV
jgi:hypothetical protein